MIVVKKAGDIDIDCSNRNLVLDLLKHHPAGIVRDGRLVKHPTGVYVTDIPVDPYTGVSTIDHHDAENRGYVKLDFLNVGIYAQVRDEAHLKELMHRDPNWDKLYDPEFCARVTHIGAHYDALIKMPEAVNTIARLAMFMAVIRPAKRHLIGLPWTEVAKTVWEKPTDGKYYFKKAHAISYSHLVVIHMNLLAEE